MTEVKIAKFGGKKNLHPGLLFGNGDPDLTQAFLPVKNW